jgi:Lon protease-like protein
MGNTNDIPLFPLNTVLFPGGVLPLRIFEARYVDMIGECMRTQTGFGVCAIRSGSEVGRAADCYAVGTLASIQDFDTGEDGLLHIIARGERRFRIVDKRIEPGKLLRARIAWLEDSGSETLPDNRRPLADFLAKLLERAGEPYTGLTTDYDNAAWVAGRLTELLPFALDDKQRLLELDAPLDRLETLYNSLLAEDVSG